MNWFASIFVGICTAPLAAIIVGTGADAWSRWLSVSNREGFVGYWVVWVSLFAAIAGLVLGISIARGWLLVAPSFFKALGMTLGITVAVTLAITALLWLATLPHENAETSTSPPPLTREQQEAEADAKQEAELRALAPDAPLAQWLVFTRYGVPQARIDAAIAAIRARPNYAAEMQREMLEGEQIASRDALQAIEHIKPPPAELADAIADVGRAIAQSLRDLETKSPDSDEYRDISASISLRFSAWMVATRALQEQGVADFVPQLTEIIEPARRLDQAYAIRIDVVRVASFYLQKWAGIAPLPTDPPPR